MKKIKIFFPFLLSLSLLMAQSQVGECNSKALKDAVLDLLKPYKYDSSKIIRFEYSGEEQVKETEVPLFMGEKYRFIFNLNAAPLGAEVRVYDKSSNSRKRKLLYSSKNKDTDKPGIFVFEPQKSKTMYIDIVIPPTDKQNQRGCVVFVLGYKI
ncbi:MAG: hypothetical protein KatS3mg034_0789 [Vicingaceae bacterium]|nr:MAG: hypothetical protein KatS3mg034_0789 [Vicingaceae bacterium]